jgi:hypothetical protein
MLRFLSLGHQTRADIFSQAVILLVVLSAYFARLTMATAGNRLTMG